ncbi:MAG: ABC transporter permease [Silicimonas sp.]|nr:ABC transporter permease [Silicimonas sp.]
MPPQVPRRLRTGRSIFALMLREMVTTYGRSPGGYLWAVLEPIAAIALLSFAFSLAFRSPTLGVSFPLFYATGYLPFMLFHDVSGKTATAIRFSRPLLSFGALTWVDVVIARFSLNLFTHLVTAGLVIVGLMALFDTRAALAIPAIALALIMVAVLSGGIGLLNAYLFLAFPAWERIWTVLTRPLFIVSGVFFVFEDLPHEVRDILWFNPVFHVTGVMRRGFYPTYPADYAEPLFVIGIGLFSAVIGLLLLSRHGDGLVHK